MESCAYDKNSYSVLVSISRDELEDIKLLMCGVANHIHEMDQAAIGIYSKKEALYYVEKIDSIVKSIPSGVNVTKIKLPKTFILEIVDVLSSLICTEGEESSRELGLSLQKIKLYESTMYSAYKSKNIA